MSDKDPNQPAKGARLSVHVKPSSTAVASGRHGPELVLAPASIRLKSVLVPTDFSEPSQKALQYAAKFGQQFDAEITLLHVIQPMVYPADFGYPATIIDTMDDTVRSQIEGRLQNLAQRFSPPMKVLLRTGQPYYEITQAAKELDADLIIIATHGYTGLKHALLGSTVERVVRHAPCPVLTVRQREHDFV